MIDLLLCPKSCISTECHHQRTRHCNSCSHSSPSCSTNSVSFVLLVIMLTDHLSWLPVVSEPVERALSLKPLRECLFQPTKALAHVSRLKWFFDEARGSGSVSPSTREISGEERQNPRFEAQDSPMTMIRIQWLTTLVDASISPIMDLWMMGNASWRKASRLEATMRRSTMRRNPIRHKPMLPRVVILLQMWKQMILRRIKLQLQPP